MRCPDCNGRVVSDTRFGEEYVWCIICGWEPWMSNNKIDPLDLEAAEDAEEDNDEEDFE